MAMIVLRSACRICFLGLLCLAMMAGCRSTNQLSTQHSALRTELNFWNGFTGPDGKTMERIVHRFNAEHKDIQVRMQIIPWGTYYDKVTLGLAYGGAPDVFILHASRLPEYANSDALSQIDELTTGHGLAMNDFMPRSLAAAHWQGKQYAIPLDCHPIGLYYNKDLFKQAGIVDAQGNAKPPTNLSEFLTDAKKLTRDTNGDGKPEQWGFVYTWLRTNSYTFLSQFDAGLLTKDVRRSDLESANSVMAYQLMTDIIYKHKVCPPPEGQDSWMGFQTNKVGMALEGIYMLSSLESQKGLNFAGAACPKFGKHLAVWGDSHMMVMPSKIDPERRKAGWEFIRYLSDNSLDWAKGGQVPVRKSIIAKPEFAKLPVQFEFSKELPYVVYMPSSVAVNQILPFSDAAVEAILMRVKSPEDALHEAARRTNNVLERQ